MSYSRGIDSDVYMFWSGADDVIVCMACKLSSGKYFEDKKFNLRTEAIKHLREHMAAGHIVGGHAIPLLEKEIREIGDKVQEKG
jgi:uncharacterized protein YoaH (UPF0181 family)